MFLDNEGNIYVADMFNNRIQKFPAGSDSTTNGVTLPGFTGANQLVGPAGIFVNKNGDVYVDDQGNGRILKWSAGSAGITTVNSKDEIKAYPNPTTGVIYFKGIESGSRVEVYDVLGQMVHASTAGKSPLGDLGAGDNYSVNLSGNAKGIYFYRVMNEGVNVNQGKIVLE